VKTLIPFDIYRVTGSPREPGGPDRIWIDPDTVIALFDYGRTCSIRLSSMPLAVRVSHTVTEVTEALAQAIVRTDADNAWAATIVLDRLRADLAHHIRAEGASPEINAVGGWRELTDYLPIKEHVA
jgi:hypothetical protein